MGERAQIQEDLVEFCMQHELNDAYGVIAAEQMIRGKAVRTVTFCKARILDATIHIYGPKFILLKWNTAIRRLAQIGSQKFDNAEQVKQFIKDNFVLNS